VNTTPEIRPLGDLPDATVDVAEHLFRSRLRCHLYMRAAAIERRSGRDDKADMYDTLIEFAAKIEANAGAAWIATLGVWVERWQCDDPQRWLRWCIRHALMEAAEGSFAVAAMRQDAHPGHDVDEWVKEFVAHTDVEDLLLPPV
jgi:hypothetical protein